MVGTPASHLVDLVSARIHETMGWLLPQGSFLQCRGLMGSFPLGPATKRALHAPTTTTSVAPREREVTSQKAPLPMGPSEAIAGPLRSSQLLAVL